LVEAMNGGDLESALALYEGGASLVARPRKVAKGAAALSVLVTLVPEAHLMFRVASLRRRALLAVTALALVTAIGTRAYRAAASDHRDSALLTANPAEDIADVYSFLNPSNPDRVVLAMTVSGFIPPSENTTTFFDPQVLYEIKLDTNADAVEDQVIQAFVVGSGPNQVMHFRGPTAPVAPGTTDRVVHGPEIATVRVSHTADPIIAERNGIKVFAGVRDDPFFFDLVQFKHVVAGEASSFNNPGADTFAGFNVLALVIELPKSLLGSSHVGVWGTTSRLAS